MGSVFYKNGLDLYAILASCLRWATWPSLFSTRLGPQKQRHRQPSHRGQSGYASRCRLTADAGPLISTTQGPDGVAMVALTRYRDQPRLTIVELLANVTC